MDQNQEPTFEESVREVMQALPQPVQRYIGEREYVPAVNQLVQKYALRVDQAGVFEQSIVLLLMGILTQAEFMHTLTTEGGFDEGVMPDVVRDVNDSIFTPVREEMERTRAAAPRATPTPSERLTVPEHMRPINPLPPPPPPPPPAASVPMMPPSPRPISDSTQEKTPPRIAVPSYIPEFPPGMFAPPPQSPRYQNQETANLNSYLHAVPTPARPPRELINKIPTRAPVPAPAPVHPAATPQDTVAPVTPTADSSRLLEDHEEPSPLHSNLPVIVESSAPDVPSAPALPGTLPAITVPVAESKLPRPVPALSPTESTSSVGTLGATPIVQSYAVDPYREPLDAQT